MSIDIRSLFDLSNRVALVTGGGVGLGREFCQVLAEFGADVVTCARTRENVENTCEIISKYGHKTLALKVDVSDYAQVQKMFEQVDTTFGRLDILVNNAGITSYSAVIDQIDISEWHTVLNVNLHGVFYCMKQGLKLMMKQKRGSIINIASTVGLLALDPSFGEASSYVASKAGVIGLTKQGASEYGRYGIRVNCIAPGWHFGTELGERAKIRLSIPTPTEDENRAFMQSLAFRTPLRRTGEPKELKGLLLYLASDASSFLTGQTIAHDGGWTCV